MAGFGGGRDFGVDCDGILFYQEEKAVSLYLINNETSRTFSGKTSDASTEKRVANESKYSSVLHSSDGLRRFQTIDNSTSEGYLYGYLDEEGDVIISNKYEYAEDFRNGEALVKEQGQYKVIDTLGNTIIEFSLSYTYLKEYNGMNGLAAKEDGKYAVIDRYGEPLTSFSYPSSTRYDWNDDLFLVSKDDEVRDGGRNLYGITASDGTQISPMIYHVEIGVDDGMLSACKDDGNGDLLYGLLDQNGKEAIPFIYDFAQMSGLGIGCVGSGGKFALIDTNGEFLTDFIFLANIEFSEGFGIGILENGYCIIDATGTVIDTLYDWDLMDGGFNNGYIQAKIDGKRNKIVHPFMESRQINIYVNDKWFYIGQEPFAIDDEVMLPIDDLADVLGCYARWEDSTQLITIQDSKKIIRLTINDSQARVNIFDDGLPEETKDMTVPPKSIDGRLWVSANFVADVLDIDMIWNNEGLQIIR